MQTNQERDEQTKEGSPMRTVLILVVVVTALIVIGVSTQSCNDSNSGCSWTALVNADNTFTSDLDMIPKWDIEGEMALSLPKLPVEQIDIMLDASVPMEGYVHEEPENTHFHEIVTQLITELDLKFGSGDVRPVCTRVDDSLKPIPNCDVRQVNLDGASSRINAAIDSVVARLKSGRIESAALVTDLMGAAGYGHTPVALMSSLRTLLPEMNDGSVKLALMGIRLNYWGVRIRSCRGSGTLGCWLHEGNRQWVPLRESVQRPLYVLLFERTEAESNLPQIVESLESSIHSLDSAIEVYTENFTEIPQQKITWHNNYEEENEDVRYDIFYDSCEDTYLCDEDVEFVLMGSLDSLTVDSMNFNPEKLILASESDSLVWISGNTSPTTNSLRVTVDCSMVRELPSDSLLQKMLTLQATRNLDAWSSWASTEERANSTIDLHHFVESLRPDFYEGSDTEFIKVTPER